MSKAEHSAHLIVTLKVEGTNLDYPPKVVRVQILSFPPNELTLIHTECFCEIMSMPGSSWPEAKMLMTKYIREHIFYQWTIPWLKKSGSLA